ncbi:hypothetical protein [Pseudomonas sp.]
MLAPDEWHEICFLCCACKNRLNAPFSDCVRGFHAI